MRIDRIITGIVQDLNMVGGRGKTWPSQLNTPTTDAMTPDSTLTAGGPGQRLDKWLFYSRLYKSRELAQTAIAHGHVWINGKTALKPAEGVKIGDRLIVQTGTSHRWLTILEIGTRRGPASEARLLYDEIPQT